MRQQRGILPVNALGTWREYRPAEPVMCPACNRRLAMHVGVCTILRLRWVGVRDVVASPQTITLRCDRCTNWLELVQAHPAPEAA